MKIYITSSIGKGPTRLAAFDDALVKAGIANYNLIRLSSVIPPGSEIIQVDGPIKNTPGGWGDKLYLVYADHRISTPNVEAWAGIGWVTDPESGKGLLVEHENYSQASVQQDIVQSLDALKNVRRIDWNSTQMVLAGEVCEREPICALAVAVFAAEDWENRITTAK